MVLMLWVGLIPSLFAQNIAFVTTNAGDESVTTFGGSLGYAVTALNATGNIGNIDFFSPNLSITLTQSLPALTESVSFIGTSPTIIGQTGAPAQLLFQDSFILTTGLTLETLASPVTGYDASVTASNWDITSGNFLNLNSGAGNDLTTIGGNAVTGYSGGTAAVTVNTWSLDSSAGVVVNGGNGGSLTDTSGSGDQGGYGGNALLTGNSITLNGASIFQITGGRGGTAADNGTGTPTGGLGGTSSIAFTSVGDNGSAMYINGGQGGLGSMGGDGGAVSLTFNSLTGTGGAIIQLTGGNGGAGAFSAGNGGIALVQGSSATFTGSNFYLKGGNGGDLTSSTGPSPALGGNGGDAELNLSSLSLDSSSYASLTGGNGGIGGSQNSVGQGGNGGNVVMNVGSMTTSNNMTFYISGGTGGADGNNASNGNGGAGGSAWVTLSSLTLGLNSNFNVNAGMGGAGSPGGSSGANGTCSVAITNLYGSGNINLTPANNGTLWLNSGLFSGNIATANLIQNSGSITLDGATNLSSGATFSGSLYGSGTISTTTASGTVQVGNGLYTGNLNAGNFLVSSSNFFTLNGTANVSTGAILNGFLILGNLGGNGVLQGSVSVAQGGGLIGYGTGSTVNGTVINSGLVACAYLPMTVTQFIQNPVGTLNIPIGPNNMSGLLRIANGAQLNGDLNPSYAGGNYGFRDQYQIISGAPVTGTFSQVQIFVPDMGGTVLYGADAVTLVLIQDHTPFGSYAINTNEMSVGSALEASLPTCSDAFLAKAIELNNLPSGQATALNQMGGVVYTALPEALIDQVQFEDGLIFNHLGTGASASPNLARLSLLGNSLGGYASSSSTPGSQTMASSSSVSPGGFWLETADSFGSSNATSQVSGFNLSNFGFIGGYDWYLDPAWTLGLLGGYLQTGVNPADGSATANISGTQFGLYGKGTFDNFDVALLGGYVADQFNVSRTVVLGSDVNNLNGSYGGGQFQAALQMDLRLSDAGSTFRPFGGFQYDHLTENSFSETGSDSLALSLPALAYDSARVYAGLEEAWKFSLGADTQLSPRLHATISQDLASLNPSLRTDFAGAPDNPFSISGISPDGTNFGIGGGLSLALGPAFNCFADFDGHFSSTGNLSTISLGMNVGL